MSFNQVLQNISFSFSKLEVHAQRVFKSIRRMRSAENLLNSGKQKHRLESNCLLRYQTGQLYVISFHCQHVFDTNSTFAKEGSHFLNQAF